MISSSDLGRLLLLAGVLIALAGGAVLLLSRLHPGGLPGDISFTRGRLSFAFPIVTCIVVSIVLSILLNVLIRLRR